MSFLNAEWRKLILVNYEIDKQTLLPYLPYKTELDNWNSTNYVSLVGFMFQDTKLLGLKIPFHVNFEEVNLRFYVRYKDDNEWKRGVVFIKELVPKHALSLVANTIYNEQYETVKMNHKWEIKEQTQFIEYSWQKFGKKNLINVDANLVSQSIQAESEEEFISEHYWGYTRVHESKTYEYEVKHPKWNYYRINEHKIDVDFAAVYGSEFKGLTNTQPKSIMLMEGSEISVESKNKIT